jgi:hypothetical protein
MELRRAAGCRYRSDASVVTQGIFDSDGRARHEVGPYGFNADVSLNV